MRETGLPPLRAALHHRRRTYRAALLGREDALRQPLAHVPAGLDPLLAAEIADAVDAAIAARLAALTEAGRS